MSRALLASDALALLVASVPAWSGLDGARTTVAAAALGAAIVLWWLFAAFTGLYGRKLRSPDHSTVDELGSVVQALTLAIWLPFVAALALEHSLPPSHVAVYWATAIPLLAAGRASTRALARQNKIHRQRTIIVGAGDVGQLIGRKFLQHPEYGIELIGFVDATPKELRSELVSLPLLGGLDELDTIVRDHEVDRVVIAFSNDRHNEILNAVRALAPRDVQIDLVPRLYELIGPEFNVHAIEGFPLLGLIWHDHAPAALIAKRVIDLVLSTALLILLSPWLLLIAVLIKLDSPGPVLFSQTRMGEGMRSFTMLKFRTMRVGTNDIEHRDYIRATMDPKASPVANNLYKLDRSDAVTRVGQALRRFSLDEFPQLLNVVKGEMSLVGPRPCIPYEVEMFQPYHFERFSMPAGITGLWQVTSRARSTFVEALDLDVAYVRNWSLWLDLRLLLRTTTCLVGQDTTA